MKVVFTKFAGQELEDSVTFYEIELSGLGIKFKNEVEKSISRIIEHPKAWSVERGEIRRALLHRFPYKILYSIEKNHILIIAIAHQHRKPDYWI